MNFPMDQPFFQFVYWLLNSPGLGGIAVFVVIGVLLGIFTLTLFWIARGAGADEATTYAYPTPALHDHSSPNSNAAASPGSDRWATARSSM